MHYWNQRNFEGLREIAEALEADPRLAPLAEYCRQRERGLRREAFDALESFLRASENLPAAEARDACQRILEVHARTPDAHQFLAHPLRVRFVHPVLEAWISEEPESQIALRWLGILRMDAQLLARALALRPDDVPVRRRLADWHLSVVHHATHHLVESQLLGDLAETKRSLATARAVVEAAPDPAPLADLRSEVSEYEALLEDWQAWSRLREGSFPEWCARRGRPYSWPAIVYYRE
jgi:hypothetical protein